MCNIVPPEFLNNVGVLRLEQAMALRQDEQQTKVKRDKSFEAFQQALANLDRLQKIAQQDEASNKLKALRITVLFNIGYWYEISH